MNVFVNRSWVLPLPNNLEQIFIRQEVEAWEVASLRVQERLQRFLDMVEVCILLHQVLKEVFLIDD